ncbi:MAG: leukotoxin LktA family filamentous adhesin, partial [Comamonadaceae bacterium]
MHSVSRLSAVRILVQRWRLAREKRGSAPRAFETRRLWQRVTAGIKPTVAFISAAAGGGLAMQVHADTVNALSTTGQTATTIGPTTNNITNITTTTKAGAMGFNAFSSFKIGTGNTVNLQLPDGTTHLINLVYDTTGIRIDGILNSVTSNKIGGHVVFANPFGMIVGSTGVLNVGSLTAIGVSSGTMDGVLSGALAATPNLAPAQALIDGTAPIVAGSVIRIDGRINALAKVKLAAGTVNVDGTIMASADARHEATFLAAVNTSGAAFDAATGFVEGAGGTIEIVGSGAGNTLNINGTLNAGSTNGGTITAQGSTINIGNADFLATTLNATGSTGTAGKINVGWTPGNLADKVTVLGEGMLLAHGNGATANGGTIDIWGTTTNEFHGLAAANGQNLGGTIRLGGGAIRVGGKIDADGYKGGGSVSIGASATPAERANSVAVTQTGKIYADAVTSGNGGTISIYGNNSNDFRGLASAKGGSVSGTGTGGTIDISAPHGLYFGGSVDTSAALGAAGSLFMQTSEACLVNVATDSSCASTLVWSSLNAAAGSVVVSTGDLLRIGGNKNGTLSSVNANFTRGAGETMTFSGGSIVFNANSAIRSQGASVSMSAGSISMGNGTVSTNGGNVTMVASETITMGAGSMINTRKGVSDAQASLDTGVTATGASGNVTMNATLIDIGGNSTSRAGIYAQGDGTRLGGDISLIAFEKADPLSDLVSKIVDVQHAQARVEVSGAVKGKTINVGATALSIAGIVESVSTQTMLDEQGNQVLVDKDVNMSTSDILKDKATDILKDLPNKGVALLMNLLGVQGAAMVAEADAVVNINGTGLIKSDGDMTIRARAEQTANAKVELGTMFVNPGAAQTAVAAATVVGVTLGGSELNIKTGATLQSGGAMSLISRNDTNLLSVAKVTSFGTDGGVALAVGVSNTSATANVASGVSITAASLDFAAQQRASYEVEGTANAFGTGKVGIGVGVGVFNGSATATMGSNVNASLASGTGNVNMEASNLVTRNFVKGATSAGSGIVLRTLDKAVLSKVRNGISAQKGAALDALGNIVTAGVDAVKSGLGFGSKTPAAPPPNTPPPPPPPSNTKIKLAAATAVNVTDLDANVTIADGVTINAKGEVGIVSIVEDKGIHNIASSAVESPPKGKETAANPGTDTGLSGGVAVGIYEHTATSHIGKNVTINAGKIGVHSEASAPLEITWLGSEWDSASDVWTFLKPKISGTLGVPEQVLTSFANATSGGNTLAVGGSVNIFDMENSATSWIGQGAVLNATSASAGGFTHKLHQDVVYGANGIVVMNGANPVYDTERSFVFNQGLTVDAVKLTEKASAAGNFSIFLGSTGAAKVGVGGSFNFNRESGTAAVVVDDNATLSSTNGNILLESQGYDRMYVVSPSSGRGTSIGGNILAAYTALDTNVITAVSNQATLKAKQVEVLASEKFNVWTAAGAVNISNDAAVGAAAAANRIGTRSEAYIGDVGDLRGLVNETAGDSADATATVYANALTVRAESSGTAGALAVAGAVVSQPPPSPPPPPG